MDDGSVDGAVDERDAGPPGDAGPSVRPDSGPRDPGAEPPPGRAVCGGVVCAEGEECCLLDARCVPIGDASCVASAGPRVVLPCAKASDCEPGNYCGLPRSWMGQACAGFVGSCTSIPTECGPQPGVCGCDGRTYASQCEARAAGVLTVDDGACGTPVHDYIQNSMCEVDELCGESWYCDESVGWCRMNDPVIACGIDAQCPEGQYCCGFYGHCVSLESPTPVSATEGLTDNLGCVRRRVQPMVLAADKMQRVRSLAASRLCEKSM